MGEKQNILSEIRLVAPKLENISREMPFSVPEGYFEMMPLKMLSKLAIPSKTPMVPEGYFESLADIMLSKVKNLEVQEELDTVAPLLNNISKKMPFSIPEGYFEQLNPPIDQWAVPVINETPQVVPLRLKKRNPFAWAAAASVAALIGVFSWQTFWNSPVSPPGKEQAAGVTKDSTHLVDLALELKRVEESSISKELNDMGLADDLGSALYYLNTENFETAIQHFSEEEIKEQLSVSGFPEKKDDRI